MRIFNKFVENKTEPSNKSDIWFDGKVFKMYKEGEWQAFTLELEAADKIYETIKDISNVYQEKLTAGDGISIKNNIISLETFYQVVDSLPKTGKTNTIYLVNSKDAELNNKLVEYIWINNTWEKLGEHKTEIKIPTPDWNAKEGAPGYIKNRTHSAEFGRIEYDQENNKYKYETVVPVDKLLLLWRDKYFTVHKNIPLTIDVNGGEDTFIVNYNGITLFITDSYGYLKHEYKYMSVSETYIPLTEAFIPDTVLKTTPQSLSTNEKNQVKANLDLVDVARQKDVDKLNEETTALWKDLKEGYHPNSTVGFADDLVGRGESVPAEFSFRASGGKSIKDGAARIKRLKGNSVVWNNMVDTRGYEGGFIIREGIKIQQGHKYLLQRRAAINGLYLIPTVDGSEDYEMSLRPGEYAKIVTSQYTDLKDSVVYAEQYCGACIISDLTHMFGAGNEPTTIEEYNARKPIVADEYAYNEGEVIHMTAEGIKSVGDNAWDEGWELGFIDPTNGNERSSQDTIRSKNFNKIIGGEQYVVMQETGGDTAQDSVCALVLYDEDKNFIDFWGIPEVYRELSIDSRARYFKVAFKVAYGTTYKNDVMISLMHSGWKADTDAKYQPYWEDRLMFDKRIKDEFPDGMSKWDAVYNKNGKGYIVKGTYGVKMKDLNIRREAEGIFIAQPIPAVANTDSNGWSTEIVSARFIGDAAAYDYDISPYNSAFIAEDSLWMNGQSLASYLTVEDFIRDYGDDMLYYQLAEPTIIEYDEPFNLDYKVADFGTEEIIAPQPSAPISADIIYQFNAVDMIREHELEITELQKKINEGNIGIDPIVWKYLCNPLVITTGLTMDKYPELIDPNTGGLKYKIPAMYRMIYNCDSPDFNSNSNFANIPVIPLQVKDYFMNSYKPTSNADSRYIEAMFEDDVWTVYLTSE